MLSTAFDLGQKLREKEYRDAYVAAQLSVTIPLQIRALRNQRGWTQAHLAKAAGMKQSQISRVETAGQGLPSVNTLLRIASAFDVGLLTWFVPYSELVVREQTFSPEGFVVAGFKEDWLHREPKIERLNDEPCRQMFSDTALFVTSSWRDKSQAASTAPCAVPSRASTSPKGPETRVAGQQGRRRRQRRPIRYRPAPVQRQG